MALATASRAQLEALLAVINNAAQVAIAEYEKLGDAPSPLATDPHPQDLQEAPNLTLIKATRLLEGACDQLCAALSPPAHTILQRSQIYYWAAFKVSQEARIPFLLQGKAAGVPIEELSAETGIEKQHLMQILRTLAARSLYVESSPGVFAHSRLSANLLSPFCLSDIADLHLQYTSMPAMNWYQYLTKYKHDATKAQHEPAWIQHDGADWWSFVYHNEKRRQTFNRSMVGFGVSMGVVASIFHFPWGDFKTVGDIGSGIGAMGGKLAQHYHHLEVTLHDLPPVMKDALSHWSQLAPELVKDGRLKFSDYSFLEASPTPGLDLYIYRVVLLNWQDDVCVTILHNCRKVMGPNSRLLIQDVILHDPDSSKKSLQQTAPEPMLSNCGNGSIIQHNVDLTMMVLFNSKLRTMAEFEALGEKAGLKLVDWYDFGDSGALLFTPA